MLSANLSLLFLSQMTSIIIPIFNFIIAALLIIALFSILSSACASVFVYSSPRPSCVHSWFRFCEPIRRDRDPHIHYRDDRGPHIHYRDDRGPHIHSRDDRGQFFHSRDDRGQFFHSRDDRGPLIHSRN